MNLKMKQTKIGNIIRSMKSPPQQAAGYLKDCSGKPPLGSGRSDGHWRQTNKVTQQAAGN